MSRRVVTERLQSTEPESPDNYADKVIKYIPADVVAAWLTAAGIINGAADVSKSTLLWISFGVGLLVTPLWTLNRTHRPGANPARTQAIVSTIAFAAWVFGTGGPFATMDWYRTTYGALVLIAATLALGLINPPKSEQPGNAS